MSLVLLASYLILKNIWDLWRGSDSNSKDESKKYGFIGAALIVGIVPCPGVVFLILFGKAYNALPLGLGMAFAMMLGMITGLSLITLLTYFSRHWATKHLESDSKWISIVEAVLGIIGGLMILVYALIVFMTVLP